MLFSNPALRVRVVLDAAGLAGLAGRDGEGRGLRGGVRPYQLRRPRGGGASGRRGSLQEAALWVPASTASSGCRRAPCAATGLSRCARAAAAAAQRGRSLRAGAWSPGR